MQPNESFATRFSDVYGVCSAMTRAVDKAKRFALAEENVLLIGESGTGKNLFAQAMHNERCCDGPFLTIDCATIFPKGIEGCCIGHEVGRSVGGERAGELGIVERAEGGTLFFDEVGALSPDAQGALLRVLDDRQAVRFGGRMDKRVGCKVISSSSKNLAAMVESGSFRADLLYRLSVLTVELAPLRDRGVDKLFLAQCFLEDMCKQNHGGPKWFSRKAEAVIKNHTWPGNVRELKNAVLTAYFASRGSEISHDDFPESVRGSTSLNLKTGSDGKDGSLCTLSLAALEKQAITLAMKTAYGNVEEASHMLGISRATLYRRLRQYESEHA
ncbi:sigma 54-interacting transcriptional regulator [Raoultibacter phocaeensis]|uniref:sigma 54-interacting transcriptional regulator n=1 Tax=Raoultibacter phocaeensis TaxID=2479841 RepID=UPI0015D5946B|nr:sigma 54-interacting transcriptional regulator [Raoultibacter phocaeensis]